MKYSDIDISPLANFRWRLNKDVRYRDITVPKGYRTNGADVPRIFWSIYPPYRSDYAPAVVVHDYLCDKEEYAKADKYFEEILRKLNVKSIDIFLLVSAVKIYHYFKYGTKGR